MKAGVRRLWVGAAVCVGAVFLFAPPTGALEAGTARAQVEAELGIPRGRIVMGNREVWYYDRGTVELLEGRVVRAEIVSAEEAARRRAAEEQALRAWRKAEAERLVLLKAAGEAELKRMLNDPQFLLLDAESQLAQWQDFMRRYPMIPVGAHFTDALRRAEDDRARRDQEERLAELERRTIAAERRAQAAEEDLERQRRYETRSVVVWPVFYPNPAPSPCPPSRPPAIRSTPPHAGGYPGFTTFNSWPYDFSAGGGGAKTIRAGATIGPTGVSVRIGH